jgi:hypothetical protein
MSLMPTCFLDLQDVKHRVIHPERDKLVPPPGEMKISRLAILEVPLLWIEAGCISDFGPSGLHDAHCSRNFGDAGLSNHRPIALMHIL